MEIATTEREEQDALVRVNAFTIASHEDYRMVDDFCAGLKELENRIKGDFLDSKNKAFAAHRAICTQEAAHLGNIAEARKIAKGKLLAWEQVKEAERQAQEAKLRAEAFQKAQEQAQEAALEAERAGNVQEAQAIIEQPIEAPVIVLAREVPKRQTTIRMVKKWRYVDPIAKTGIKTEYLMPDEIKINGVVRALGKAAEGAIGGIEVYEIPA